jgi:hypothetical protein
MSIPLFPVYLASKGFTPPEKGMYYVVAKDGIYMRLERAHGTAFVKVKEVPFLDSVPKTVNYTLPKIPARIMAQAKVFFREVFSKHHSESYLTLLYSKKLQDYKLWCPKQTVSYASVHYDRADQVPEADRAYLGNEGDEWQMIGTIHSHCDFSAFHSGTDQADEASFDGIHLTFGHVNSDKFSIASSVCFNASRTVMEPLSVADGIIHVSEEEVSQEDEENVNGFVYKQTYKRQEVYYSLYLSDAEKDEINAFVHDVLPTWMEKVEKNAPVLPPSTQSSSEWVYKGNWSAGNRGAKNEDWQDITRGQSWLWRDRSWNYNSRKDDNEWGIREWDGD